MATAQDLIERALQKITAEEDVANFTATQLADALDALNDMLDSWSLERDLQYQLVTASFNTANGTNSYAIGTGQTWDTSIPIEIDSAFIRVSSSDYPVTPIKEREYQKIQNKSAAGRPDSLFFQKGASTGAVYLHPTPIATEAIHLVMLKELATFSTLATTVSLPRGYQRAIVLNLSMELADDYGWTPSEFVKREAERSLARLGTIHSAIDRTGYAPNAQDRGLVLDGQQG